MIVISLYFDILKFKSTKINLKLFINIFLNQINFYLYYFYFLYSKIVKQYIFSRTYYIFLPSYNGFFA
jgi:hypothetical protein